MYFNELRYTIEALQDIYAEFGDDVEIVGVHAPEFDYEADVDRIVEAVDIVPTMLAADIADGFCFGKIPHTGPWQPGAEQPDSLAPTKQPGAEEPAGRKGVKSK